MTVNKITPKKYKSTLIAQQKEREEMRLEKLGFKGIIFNKPYKTLTNMRVTIIERRGNNYLISCSWGATRKPSEHLQSIIIVQEEILNGHWQLLDENN